MLSGPELSRAVRAAGIDVPPVWEDEVDSTNRLARELATAPGLTASLDSRSAAGDRPRPEGG